MFTHVVVSDGIVGFYAPKQTFLFFLLASSVRGGSLRMRAPCVHHGGETVPPAVAQVHRVGPMEPKPIPFINTITG